MLSWALEKWLRILTIPEPCPIMFSSRKARGQFAGRPVVTDRESRRTIAGLCPDPRFVAAAPGGFRASRKATAHYFGIA